MSNATLLLLLLGILGVGPGSLAWIYKRRQRCNSHKDHLWLWPWQEHKTCFYCGRIQTLAVGENSVLTGKGYGGAARDVLYWPDGAQAATGTGELGMSSTGRPSFYVDGAARSAAHTDELNLKDSAFVFGLIGERAVAQIDSLGTSIQSGTCVIATNTGTPTSGISSLLTAGDLAEWNGEG